MKNKLVFWISTTLFLNIFLLALPLSAQTFEYFPGAKYDAAIPTLQQIVRHDWGERITAHHELERYLEALQKAAPERVKLVKYGETWEGRALYYLVIGSAENIARIDQIKAGMQKLADPRTVAAAEANTLINSLPAVVWLECAVHGNEISGTDAGLLAAYHLLAAQNDELVEAAMKNALVIIDPLQNPDGRDRFVNFFRQNVGRWPEGDQQAAEHNEPWPSGRVNHYLFDMNRDWFAQTQVETRGRTRAYLEWFPQVFADLHEMGSESSYYFAPPALPWNPNLTGAQLEWLTRFGRNNAQWFDKFRFDYFTRENYDSFYPGYGEGWPMFHGSIGMTYEQASARGLLVNRSDETVMHYRDTVQHHFIAALSTIEHTAKNRAALLRYFYDYRRTALEEGQRETVKEFIITPGNDASRAARLAATLMLSGIEVKRADRAFSNARTRDYHEGSLQAREFPAGSYIVSLAQPAKRLAKTLLERHTEQDKVFLDEQRSRNRARQREQFYDVTAWSLPLIFDLPCYAAEQVSNAQTTLLKELPQPAGKLRGEAAKLAYLIPWGTQAAAATLADLFRQNVRVHSSDKPFRLQETDFPPGTLIVKVKDNPADLHERLTKLAADRGAEIFATDSAWVDAGVNFGSSNVRYLPRPRVALAYNTPAAINSTGWTRYLIEQRYGYPVTTVRADQLRVLDLTKYNVLILPDTAGGYGASFGDAARLRDWVNNGGTLIALAGAAAWLTDERVGLLPVKVERREKPEKKDEAKEEKKDAPLATATKTLGRATAREGAKEPAKELAREPVNREPNLEKLLEPPDEPPSATPGALLRVRVERGHWLGFGYGETTTVMVDSNRIFPLLKLDRGVNVAIYAPEEKLLVSGFMFDDAKKQLPNKAYLMYAPTGRGHVVAFAEDPNYRAFMDGLNVLLLNAVFFGPGH